ncbi:MAG TPA: hypothetical protein PKW92_08395 [Smithella sp.]|nr:hypothetical protein [Smithella sp.]HPX31089.1 hypothetical protein [Smithella sp.]HQL98440.1 hypothetical protein [Smithella sp.]HQN70486.1 hypothetical protein [Smithella sp.]
MNVLIEQNQRSSLIFKKLNIVKVRQPDNDGYPKHQCQNKQYKI